MGCAIQMAIEWSLPTGRSFRSSSDCRFRNHSHSEVSRRCEKASDPIKDEKRTEQEKDNDENRHVIAQ